MSASFNWKLERWQIALVAAGLVIAVSGIYAYHIGLSSSRGLSAGKVALVVSGLSAAVIGLLGKKTLAAYKAGATILLNLIVLAVVVEFSLAVKARLRDFIPGSSGDDSSQRNLSYVGDGREDLPYFSEHDWGKTYWREYHAAWDARVQSYIPYLVWRIKPFQGETLNVGDDGLRVTPGADCTPGAYRVFTFGGSTMWGTGVPDWGTIPAILQSKLATLEDRPVCVKNYSEQGYVSTQSLIQLVLLLQSGEIPDLAIFYDGINDVFAAYESGQPAAHHNVNPIAARLENRREVSPLVAMVSPTRTFKLISRLAFGDEHRQIPAYQRRGVTTDTLLQGVTQAYLGNYQLATALADTHRFRALFFWQTSLLTADKQLTEEELNIKLVANGVYPGAADLYRLVDQRIEQASASHDDLYHISDVFRSQSDLVFIDPFHVTIEGNELISAKMLEAMRKDQAR